MSREQHQPTEPLHPRCGAHCGRAARAAAAAQPPPGPHSLARRPGRRRTEGREGGGGERDRESRRSEEKAGRAGTGGGGAGEEGRGALRYGVWQRGKPPGVKLFQSRHLLSSLSSPHGRAPALGKEGRGDPEGEKPQRRVSVRAGTASLPPTAGCRHGGGVGRLPVRGRVALEEGSENKQLKMAATAAASHAPQRKRPRRSAAAQRAGATTCAEPGGGREAGRPRSLVAVKHRGGKGGGRGCEGASARGGWEGKLLSGSARVKGGVGEERLPSRAA